MSGPAGREQPFNVRIPNVSYWMENIPCQYACPVHTDARGYVRAIAAGDFEAAYLIARGPTRWPLSVAASVPRPVRWPVGVAQSMPPSPFAPLSASSPPPMAPKPHRRKPCCITARPAHSGRGRAGCPAGDRLPARCSPWTKRHTGQEDRGDWWRKRVV